MMSILPMKLLLPLSIFMALLFSQASLGSLFGKATALPADQAIQFTTTESKDALLVNFELANNIYLYKDKIKLTFPDKSQYTNYEFIDTAQTIEDPSFGRVEVFFESATLKIDRHNLPKSTQALTLKYQGCDEAIGLCYPPQKVTIDIAPAIEPTGDSSLGSISTSDLNNASGINQFLQDAGIWFVIATFLVLGIGLTFTPCVLPMVPILSSVIAGQKNPTARSGFFMSVTYVLGMAITFAIAGTVVGLLGARFNLQIYMQQPWVLGVFAGLFVLLALSMFGLYELRLPRFIQDPLDRLNQQQKGGSLIGVFLMGALSAVVVSPCVTAPLAGALVYISTTGDALLGAAALFALGLGMGLPLIVIGTTGASVMPKAGAWMDQVKVFFGVLLIAVAIWILGRVLPEAVYLFTWATLLALYAVVLGAFETAATAKQRIIKGLALLMFSLAFILLFNATSGYLAGSTQLNTNNASVSEPRLNSTMASNSTQNQDVFFKTITTESDFKTALKNAKDSEQLVFVDVYADWCIECKIMSNTLLADNEVRNALDRFMRIKLDITAFDEFHKSYLESQKVFGPPSLIFYGLDGNSISDATILGEISKPDFLNHLEQFDP
jgi:thiol:disulfide interchange protein DsbD